MDRKSTGNMGEAIASKWYTNQGYEILETNYRFRRAEIDLIVLREEKELVFVEVKTRKSNSFGEPETFVSLKQQERVKDAAEDYIFAINWKGMIRFDIACVYTNGQLDVIEDAF